MSADPATPWPHWTPGAEPGVYARLYARPAPEEVCLDVAAFVGVALRGPRGEARSVGSTEELGHEFGDPIPGGALHTSLRLYFENGGRRAVIVALPEGPEPTRSDLLSALDALERWDSRHPTEPIATVCWPELVLPTPPPPLVEPEARPMPGTRFSDQLPAALPPSVCPPPPRLGWLRSPLTPSDLDVLRLALQRCAAADRVLMLDHAPGLEALLQEPGSGHLVLISPRGLVGAPLLIAREAALTPLSGAVAGLVARREREAGVAASPVGWPLSGIAALDPEAPSPPDDAITLLVAGRTGLSLRGAPVAGDDPAVRGWPARRLLQHLRRQIARDLQWAVFEPLDARLCARVERVLERRLGRLAASGALVAGGWRASVTMEPDRGALILALELLIPSSTHWIALRLAVSEGAVSAEGIHV